MLLLLLQPIVNTLSGFYCIKTIIRKYVEYKIHNFGIFNNHTFVSHLSTKNKNIYILGSIYRQKISSFVLLSPKTIFHPHFQSILQNRRKKTGFHSCLPFSPSLQSNSYKQQFMPECVIFQKKRLGCLEGDSFFLPSKILKSRKPGKFKFIENGKTYKYIS